MTNTYKPKVFIGSTKEAVPLMNLIADAISSTSAVQPWNNGFFEKNRVSLSVLIRKIPEFDYAVMLFTPDDVTTFRGREYNSVRDNIVFEAGLFMSVLGMAKVFVILCETDARPTKKLSDTDGLNYVSLRLFQDSGSRIPIYDRTQLNKEHRQEFDERLDVTCKQILEVIANDKNTEDIRNLKDSYFATQKLLYAMIRKKGLEFEVPIMKWRFDREHAKFRNIDNGHWTALADETYSYVRYVFMQILGTLKKGDEYYTVTNIEFWRQGTYGVEEFINSNSDALAKGVEIRRIMLLEEHMLNTKYYRDELIAILNKFHQKSQTDRISFCVVDKLPQFRAVRHIPFVVVKRRIASDEIRFLTLMPTIEVDSKKSPQIDVYFKSNDEHHHECISLFEYCEKHKNFNHAQMARYLNLKLPKQAKKRSGSKGSASKPK